MTSIAKNMFVSNETLKQVSVTEFYSGKSVMVTGFTGLIGKLVVEKLLWSCPEIDRIYILLRSKKGLSPQDRLEKVTKLLAFDRIKDRDPGMIDSKLVAIEGDLSSDGLGLNETDTKTICNNVSVVIHSAASVRFDDTLETATRMNMIGTKQLLDLALNMKKLECFLHVSTAYSNCDMLLTKEIMYPAKLNWKNMVNIVENIDPITLQTLSLKIMDDIPNTYIYTKGLTEHIVNDYKNQLPVAIVRPSVVVPSWKEPVPGWIDNPYGPLGINVGFITGIAHCGWGDKDGFVNYIHTDFVVNSIILAAYKKAVIGEANNGTPIYNACSPPSYKCTHNDYMLLHTYPPCQSYLNEERINYFKFKYIKPYNCFRINFIFRHMISALLIDLLLTIMGKPPLLTKVRRGVFIANKRLKYFVENSLTFDTNNFLELPNNLNEYDKEQFGYDFHSCNMKDTYYNAIVLSKHILLKPLFKNITITRNVLKWLYILDTGAVIMTYLSIFYLLFKTNIVSFMFKIII